MDCPQQQEILNAYEQLYGTIRKAWNLSTDEVKEGIQECGDVVHNLLTAPIPGIPVAAQALKEPMKSAAAKLQGVLEDGRIRGTVVDAEVRKVLEITAKFLTWLNQDNHDR